MKRAATRALAVLAFFLPLAAEANGFDANVLRPGPPGRGTVAVPYSDSLRTWDFEGAVAVTYIRNPIELSDAEGNRIGGVLKDTTTAFGRVSLGLPARLELGILMPFVISSRLDAQFAANEGARGGDLGAGLKWNPIHPGGSPYGAVRSESPFGLAIEVGGTAPTGAPYRFSGSGAATGTIDVLGDVRLGGVRLGVLGGVRLKGATAEFRQAKSGHEAFYAAAVEWGPGSLARRLVFSAELAGAMDFSRGDGPLEAIAAARWGTPAFGVVLAGGAGLVGALGTPDFRILVGAAIRSSRERDEDGDGIVDEFDACPGTPEDRDGHDDVDGCPDDDDDGDGVPDAADRCPGVAEDGDGFEDSDGCPDTDDDTDGIPDRADRCPRTAEDADGVEDDDGCPDGDNDGDGVADSSDRCPGAAETRNGFEDGDGCPDVPPPFVFNPGERIIFDNVEFRPGSDDLLRESLPILDQVATSLGQQPQVRVRIEGHTDDEGPSDRNLALSQRRALAVVNYLIGAGVDSQRLEHAGFGETRPVESNETAAGRAKNRRVEIVTLGAR